MRSLSLVLAVGVVCLSLAPVPGSASPGLAGAWGSSSEPAWVPLAPAGVAAGGPGDRVSARVSDESPGAITLEITVPGFFGSEITVGARTFADVDVPECGRTTEVGKASVPVLRRAVEIPQGAEPRVEVVEWNSTAYSLPKSGMPGRIFPAQAPVEKLRGALEAAEFRMSEAFYQSSKPYPDFRARIAEIGQVRGHRYALIEVAPVSYRPADGTIEVATAIRLRVLTPGADEALTRATIDRYASGRFDLAASGMLLNYRAPAPQAVPALPVGYLIITDPDFFDAVGPLAEWKNGKGYEATITRTTDVPGGATTSAIKAYILDAWENWDVPPSFVLLVGDVADIPNWTGTETDNPPTDLYYSTMTTGDYIPDLGIGRLSVTTPAQASGLVGKIVEYEQDLFGGSAWLKRAVFMASEDNYSITEGTHNSVISTYLDPAGYSYDKLYCHTYSATTQQVRDAYNAGRGLGIYSGHGASTYWADGPVFYQSDVTALTNLDTYPFVQSYACYTGDYTVSECFAETWIRNADKASLGFCASSVTSYWDEDDVLESGVFRALFNEGLTWISGMTNQGKWHLYEYYGGSGSTKRYYEMYNLMGDPSLDVWTDEPVAMEVSHAGTCPVGASSYAVHVEDASGPVADALACISTPGETRGTGYTDAQGDVTLVLDPAPAQTGLMYLTVTSHNHAPAFDTVEVVVPAIVTIDPDTIYVETPTAVTVTVTDTLYQPMQDVVVTIAGWGLSPALVDTTDALGQAVMAVDAPYGEVLSVTGRETGESYDCFEAPLVVAGAAALADADVEARVDLIGLAGALTPNVEGRIVGRAGHAGLDMYAAGCGVSESVSSPADSAVLIVTPSSLGTVSVALASPGYEIYTESVPVIYAYGTLAGTVTDAVAGDSLAGAAVSGYPEGSDPETTEPFFETVSQAGGAYAAPDSIPAGMIDIYAVKFGYLDYAGSVMLRVGANTLDVGLSPAPSGTVAGRVAEQGTGKPISATIEVYRSDDQSLFTQTDSDSLLGGVYSTDALPYFGYRFKVSAQHYMTLSLDVTVDEPSETVNFEMVPTQGNLLVIDDYTGAGTFETKFGPKGQLIQPGGRSDDAEKSAAVIAQDLAGLGYDVTTEASAATNPATWTGYDAVIWSSGDDTSPVATAAYRSNLNAYVAGLGKLLIEGGEIGYDAASSPGYPNFADTTLHVASWQHDSSGNLAVEQAAHPVASSPNALPSTIAVSYSNYGDSDALVPDGEASIVFDWSSYAGQSGVLVYDGTPDPASGQVVFYSFDYASVTDATSRLGLLENTIVYLLAEEGVPEGSIAGQVALSGQAGHEGAVVRVSPMGLADTTDASGYFLIDGLYDATYQVTASKAGFAESTATVVVAGGAAIGGVDFTLYPVLEYSASPEAAIPDNNSTGIRVYLDVPADAELASVDCCVNLTHTYRGDLVAELTSPEGTTVRLHNRSGGSADNIVTWYDIETQPDGPGTMADFEGELAEGRWQLYIADLAGSDTGTLHSWALRLAFPPVTSGSEEPVPGIPEAAFLEGGRPNPFGGATALRFGIPTGARVRIAVYDVRGRSVATIADRAYPAGIHTATWDGTDASGKRVAGGIYFCRLTAGSYSATRRVVSLE